MMVLLGINSNSLAKYSARKVLMQVFYSHYKKLTIGILSVVTMVVLINTPGIVPNTWSLYLGFLPELIEGLIY